MGQPHRDGAPGPRSSAKARNGEAGSRLVVPPPRLRGGGTTFALHTVGGPVRRFIPLCFTIACSDYALEGGSVDPAPRPEDDQQVDSEHEDLFEVEAVLADLVFFGDTSSSMAEELAEMGAQIEAFTARLEEGDADWQMVAVTGPTGCNQGGIFTPDTPDLAAAFGAGIATPPGEDEVDEWGLHNTTTALENTDEGECNAGLLRENANVQVIVLSDEADHSPGWDLGDAGYQAAYVARMREAVGTGGSFSLSAVTGDDPTGCVAASGATAERGAGYLEAAAATDGSFVSICGEWAGGLALIAESAASQRTFTLSTDPLPETLSVAVNREVRTTWSFDPSTRSLHFSANGPRAGDVVSIRYEAAP